MNWSPFAAPLPPPARNLAKLMVATADAKGFETVPECRKENNFRINRLKVHNSKEAAALGRKLLRCKKGCRCLSPACRICVRRWRLWACGEMLRMYPSESSVLEGMTLATLVHDDWVVPAGELDTIDPGRIIDRVRKALKREEFHGVAIGGLDVDFDPDTELWFVHVHIIIEGLTKEIERKLRDLYPASENIPRPMVLVPVTNAPRQFSYALKFTSKCRKRYLDHQGRMNTRKERQRVLEPHHTEFLLWLDRFAVSDLMLLVGVRRYGGQLQRWGGGQRG